MSKHRKHQVVLSVSIVAVTVLSVAAPQLQVAVTFIGCAVNLAWLWES